MTLDPDKFTRTPDDDHLITVCSACLRASCWNGEFMCDNYRHATTQQMTVKELAQLDIEHPSYWLPA